MPAPASKNHSFPQMASQDYPVQHPKVLFSAIYGLPQVYPTFHKLLPSESEYAELPAHNAWSHTQLTAVCYVLPPWHKRPLQDTPDFQSSPSWACPVQAY